MLAPDGRVSTGMQLLTNIFLYSVYRPKVTPCPSSLPDTARVKGWNWIADTLRPHRHSLVGTGHLDKAAIFNTEGTSVWATSSNFTVRSNSHFPETHPTGMRMA